MWSRMRKILVVFISAAFVCGMVTSCRGFIYDNDECVSRYRVKFRYDMNMLHADAFAHEVKAVTLYVIDHNSGKVVLTKSEKGEKLAEEGYYMEVDAAPGKYDLLAWCDADEYKSFSIADSDVKNGLTCTLNRKQDNAGKSYVDSRLDDLYYGYKENVEFRSAQKAQEVTVSLMKDTKDIKVFLQHTSGEPLKKDKFDFYVTDDNGKMNWDNSLMQDDQINYHAWSVTYGKATVDVNTTSSSFAGGMSDGNAVTKTEIETDVLCAELNVGRLLLDHRRGARLNVSEKIGGKIVLSVPLIDYALLFKGQKHNDMDDQDFLDRQGEYDMIFFLDDDDSWISQYVYINSWKLVLQNEDL